MKNNLTAKITRILLLLCCYLMCTSIPTFILSIILKCQSGIMSYCSSHMQTLKPLILLHNLTSITVLFFVQVHWFPHLQPIYALNMTAKDPSKVKYKLFMRKNFIIWSQRKIGQFRILYRVLEANQIWSKLKNLQYFCF